MYRIHRHPFQRLYLRQHATPCRLYRIRPPLALEPSAPPPKAKDYPGWLKAKAVAMHRSGETRETIRAMLIEQFGRAPDITNWSKTVRRWEASNQTAPGS
ncbi:hypothetical protein Alvin_1706 [Allochromatium vinosum DSM 180]|uniref:Uncharacterized protein n=1 Tax=Allochromatium vinosum (strain ATCC 17899 / DSM 180 / NBRC 103801 / NCIMB 10441 / D) TaxID=572477 RepID=D3RTX9_ALLVD|nr:hypothetical protein Alvin_1706 [Allochromatium vinosum DSM 180]